MVAEAEAGTEVVVVGVLRACRCALNLVVVDMFMVVCLEQTALKNETWSADDGYDGYWI